MKGNCNHPRTGGYIQDTSPGKFMELALSSFEANSPEKRTPIESRKRPDDVSFADFLLALQGVTVHGQQEKLALGERREEDGWGQTAAGGGRNMVDQNSLPVYGLAPCTAYCPECSQDVHTFLEYSEDPNYSQGVLSLFELLFDCCSSSAHLNRLRVHRCSRCSRILARGTK